MHFYQIENEYMNNHKLFLQELSYLYCNDPEGNFWKLL